MRFVPIAPISLQEEYVRPYLFALAHQLGDLRYETFFADSGRFSKVILDNGAYEGSSLDIRTLVERAKKISASELILPDKLFDDAETYKLTKEAIRFLFRHRNSLPDKLRFMLVPQGANSLQWAVCMQQLIEDYMMLFPDKPFTLGIPKVTKQFIGGRLRLLDQYILEQQEKFKFDIHLLGIGEELDLFKLIIRKYGESIRTADSARPFIWAYHNQVVSPIYEPNKYPGRPDDYFNASFSHIQQSIAHANVYTYERLCLYDGQD